MSQIYKKIILFFSLFFLLFFFKITNAQTHQCQNHNVWGWAWSENIGWISFSCRDRWSVGQGINYGVDIDPATGNLSGYAWSEHIGWIRFDPEGPYPTCPSTTCPSGSPNYSARLNLNTKKVTGWARACSVFQTGCTGALKDNSERGGWNGWILMGPIVKGGTDYGVWIDNALNPAQFKGWAWGSDVLGWISFNTTNYAGGSDFKVLTSLTFNQAPVADFWCCPSGCNNCPTEGACQGYVGTFCLKNRSSDSDNNLQNSVWLITQTGFTSNCLAISGNPICDFTPNLPTSPSNPITYTAQLTATDSNGLSSSLSKNFNLLQDIRADFQCSLSQTGPWSSCDGFRVNVGQEVYFRDTSVQSTGGTINSWSWTFPSDWRHATSSNSSIPNPFGHFNSGGEKEVRLCVTDTNNRSACVSAILNVRRLPIWFPGAP